MAPSNLYSAGSGIIKAGTEFSLDYSAINSLSGAGGTPADVVKVTSDASVGIGTATPNKWLGKLLIESEANVGLLWAQGDAANAVLLASGKVANGGFIRMRGHSLDQESLQFQDFNGGDVGIRWKNGSPTENRWNIIASMSDTGLNGMHFRSHAPDPLVANNFINVMSLGYATGNVGIGVTNPLARLHVNGALLLNKLTAAPALQANAGFLYAMESIREGDTNTTLGMWVKSHDTGNGTRLNSHEDPRSRVPSAVTSHADPLPAQNLCRSYPLQA